MKAETLAEDHSATTDDVFLGGKLVIRQPAQGYRAGTDAVLLAASVTSPATDGPILDAGAGVGTVALCIASRLPSARVVLVEREPALVALARRNIERNGFSARARVIEADLARASGALDAAGIACETFSHVLANPPFHDEGAGTAARSGLKATSHQMPRDDLDTWVRFLNRMACPGGAATMIHKADALTRILAAFEGRFGAIRVRPVVSRANDDAGRVIVTGIKGSRAPLSLAPPLVLHTDGHAFRPEIEAVFRHGAALPA
jgi:FkbM family methyltransferase